MEQNTVGNPSRQTIIRQIETLNKSIRTKEGRLAVLRKEIESNKQLVKELEETLDTINVEKIML
jgi:septal ring factor EnvC (AmiA/AmiB activator)